MRPHNSIYKLLLLGFTITIWGSGCSESGSSAMKGYGDDADGWWDSGVGSEAPNQGDPDGFPGHDEAPAEQEDDFLALRPAQTDIHVFIANPTRNTVTRVNVNSLEVRTTDVGNDPALVKITEDFETAVVLNRGDDSISIIDALSLDQRVVEVRDNLNNMVISSNAQWTGLWHDEFAVRWDDPPIGGIQSFNEVSFVNLESGAHIPMVVGFDPKEIQFTPDSSTAVVVADESLAVIDLSTNPPALDIIRIASDLIDPPEAEEVVISPNGKYAFVRQFGAQDLVIVNLESHDVERVAVGNNPTDLDLSPDGTKAVVVARASKEIWVFDANQPFEVPEVHNLPESELFGSLVFDPIGDQAVLYTTATRTPRYATWNLQTNEIDLRSLVKPIQSVTVTPTGESLLVFHTKEDQEDPDISSPFYNSWALTLIDLSDFRTNPLRLPAEPIGYANANNGRYGYFIMENEQYMEVLDYATLLPTEFELRSNPVYVGVLPDLDPTDGIEPRAWVSQEHNLGRISFYDPASQEMETITGFELNAHIEEAR